MLFLRYVMCQCVGWALRGYFAGSVAVGDFGAAVLCGGGIACDFGSILSYDVYFWRDCIKTDQFLAGLSSGR